MNLKQLKIEIDRDQHQVVDLMQGYTYKFEFAVEEKGTSVDLTGVTATLDMLRGDKTFIKQTDGIVITGNIVKCNINTKFTTVSGVCKMQLILKKGEEIFGSWVIECRVKPSAISDNDGDGENIITSLEKLNEDVKKAEEVRDELNNLVEGVSTPGQWITPTFLNGATGTLKYRKTFAGRLEFKGEVTVTSATLNFILLPVELRPAEDCIFGVLGGDNTIKKASFFRNGYCYMSTINVKNHFDGISIPLI